MRHVATAAADSKENPAGTAQYTLEMKEERKNLH